MNIKYTSPLRHCILMALGLCFTFQAESQLIHTAPKKPVVEEKKPAPKPALPLKKGSQVPVTKKDTVSRELENTNADNLKSQPKTLPITLPASFSNQLLEQGSTKLTFVEQFNTNALGWSETSDKEHDFKLVGGKYRMACSLEKQNWHALKPIDMDIDKDFTVSVIATWQAGVENNRFGIMFCSDKRGDNFMFFGVSADGHFMIADFKDSTWFPMKDWGLSEKVNKKYVPNLLTIKKEGKIISYYLNEQLIFSMPFQGGFGRTVGFRVNDKQTVDFDQLEINATRLLIPDKMGMVKPDLLFYDPFDTNKGWPIPSEKDNAMFINDGKFTIRGLEDRKHRLITRSFPINLQGNFSVSCKARSISGNNVHPFGIVFGSDDAASPLYYFNISADGYFVLWHAIRDPFLKIIPWTSSDLVKIGNNVNEIEIRKVGKYLEFYINGKMADKVISPVFKGNYIGLNVAGDQTVEFDDFTVMEMK